eukprot:GHVS01014512.1.p1 GENE.GHVS01014512.1~~GHVS01014512.1.p1  ORF type:complete len:185 (+),score=26.22 GHVS01014512.1:136-690(+)
MQRTVNITMLTTIVVVVLSINYAADCISLQQLIDTHKDLRETKTFAQESGVIDDIANDEYGSDITMMMPNNRAWNGVSRARRNYLMDSNNRADLETLLLFSTSDTKLHKRDFDPGMPPLITLLGVEATVDRAQNKVCVLSMHDNRPFACARVVQWDVPVDEGVVHILDQVLFPEELIEMSEFPA